MTREEYIESVVANINDKQTREEIAAEIAAHIDDRIRFYTDAGYDYDYALSQALEKMGNSEAVSQSMSRLYKNNFGDKFAAYWILLSNVVCILLVTLALWESYDFRDYLRMEYFGIFGVLYAIAIAVKHSDKRIIKCGLIYYIFVIAIKALMIIHMGIKSALTSPILIFISSLMTGDIQAVKTVISVTSQLIPSNLLFIISVIIYTLIGGVVVYFLLFLSKAKVTNRTLRQNHIKKYTFKVCIGLLLFICTIVMLFCIFGIKGIKDSYKAQDRIVIVESDTIVDFSNELTNDKLSDIAYEDKSKLDVNGKTLLLSIFDSRNDLEPYYEYNYIDTVNGKSTSSYMSEGNIGKLKYLIKNNVLDYTPNYDYVYVFSFPADPDEAGYSFKKEYRKSNWVKTNKKSEFTYPVEQGKYPVNINHITIESKNK